MGEPARVPSPWGGTWAPPGSQRGLWTGPRPGTLVLATFMIWQEACQLACHSSPMRCLGHVPNWAQVPPRRPRPPGVRAGPKREALPESHTPPSSPTTPPGPVPTRGRPSGGFARARGGDAGEPETWNGQAGREELKIPAWPFSHRVWEGKRPEGREREEGLGALGPAGRTPHSGHQHQRASDLGGSRILSCSPALRLSVSVFPAQISPVPGSPNCARWPDRLFRLLFSVPTCSSAPWARTPRDLAATPRHPTRGSKSSRRRPGEAVETLGSTLEAMVRELAKRGAR